VNSGQRDEAIKVYGKVPLRKPMGSKA